MAVARLSGIAAQAANKWLELQKGLADLELCISESVLYADQQSYESLQKMNAKYKEIIAKKDDPETAAKVGGCSQPSRA